MYFFKLFLHRDKGIFQNEGLDELSSKVSSCSKSTFYQLWGSNNISNYLLVNLCQGKQNPKDSLFIPILPISGNEDIHEFQVNFIDSETMILVFERITDFTKKCLVDVHLLHLVNSPGLQVFLSLPHLQQKYLCLVEGA